MKKPEDQLVPAAPKLSLPQDVPPSLKRQGAMYAPVTSYFQGPDAAAGKLVDMRLQRAGATPPSTIGPPAPAAPPPTGLLQRMAPSSAANIRYGTTARAGEGIPEMLGRGTTGALGVITAVPEALARSTVDVAGGAYDAAKRFAGGAVGNPVQTAPAIAAAAPAPAPAAPAAAAAPAAVPQATGAVQSPLARPGFMPAPAAAPAVDTTMLGPLKRAQASGEVGRSVAGRMLPGAPQVGADGSIVYDQAFMDRNRPLVSQYAQTNVVPTVVPPPGVAASMATGGQTPVGTLTRRNAGFTPADRARQMEQLNDLGNNYRQTRAEGRMQFANMEAMAGNTDKAKGMADVFQAGLTRAAPSNQGAALQADAARLGLDQANTQNASALAQQQANQEGALMAEQVAGQKLQNRRAAILSNLQELMASPDKTVAATAREQYAAMNPQEQKPLVLNVPMDSEDALGNRIPGQGQVAYVGGQWIDPRQQQVRYATHPDGRKLKVFPDGTFEEVKPE